MLLRRVLRLRHVFALVYVTGDELARRTAVWQCRAEPRCCTGPWLHVIRARQGKRGIGRDMIGHVPDRETGDGGHA